MTPEAEAVVAAMLEEEPVEFVDDATLGWFRAPAAPHDVTPTIDLADGSLEWLRAALQEGRAVFQGYGYGVELRGVRVPPYVVYGVVEDRRSRQVVVWVERASEAWLAHAERANALLWPPEGDQQAILLARPTRKTGPPAPTRNERCPCGSGIKTKRCHGR